MKCLNQFTISCADPEHFSAGVGGGVGQRDIFCSPAEGEEVRGRPPGALPHNPLGNAGVLSLVTNIFFREMPEQISLRNMFLIVICF